MDYGSTNPTAGSPFATDYDGNVIVFDQYYSPGLGLRARMKKCPSCGACQECGRSPYQPWWGVIPPYPIYPTTPVYPGPTTPYTTTPYTTGGGTWTVTSNTTGLQ
jgi:hypothetical protein